MNRQSQGNWGIILPNASGSEQGRCSSASYSRLRHLANAIYGPHDAGSLIVVALTAYFDGSWNDDEPSVMAVGGFISSEKRWLWFEKEWAKLLARFDLKYFRMEEFAHFHEQFKGWENREDDRQEFIRCATEIIGKTAWQSVSAAVLNDDWKFANEGYQLAENRFHPYPLCGWACIQHVRIWCREQKRPYPVGQVIYAFEKGDPNQDELRKLADEDFGIEIQTIDKVPKDLNVKPIGALQAADFASWHIHNIVRRHHEGVLERYRKDFELLFSRVPTYPHHVHFSMEVHPRRLPEDEPELASIRNESDSDEASLVRFCQDHPIPMRPGYALMKKPMTK